ncbi:MAG: DUF4147 domain-containing protein [Acidobacteriota bacterium]|nr:DUF4147 domain-containing protein [Acidobacteriota bacterium]
MSLPVEEPRRSFARELLDAALAAVDPAQAVTRHFASVEQRLAREGIERVRVAAVGKAAWPMARGGAPPAG